MLVPIPVGMPDALAALFSPYDLLVVLGTALAIVGWSQPCERRMRFYLAAAGGLSALYYGLMGMPITAWVIVFTASRVLITAFYRRSWLGFVFLALNLSTPLWVDGTDYAAIAATTLGTVAYFWLHGARFRFALVICSAIFGLNALWHGVWLMLVVELLGIGINTRHVLRLRRARAPDKPALPPG